MMNDQEWQSLRNKARGIALEEYSTEASSIIRLTKEEINSIIEESLVDKEKLSDLISVVNDTSKSNSEKAEAWLFHGKWPPRPRDDGHLIHAMMAGQYT